LVYAEIILHINYWGYRENNQNPGGLNEGMSIGVN